MSLLEQMHSALDNFDTLQIDEVIEVMEKFRYSGKNMKFFEELKSAAKNGDIDKCVEVLNERKELITKETV